MADPDEFPDLDSISDYIDRATGKLMDLNHKTTQETQREIQRLEKYKDQYCSLIEEMQEVLAIGGMLHSRLTGDMIMEEYGIELVEEDGGEE